MREVCSGRLARRWSQCLALTIVLGVLRLQGATPNLLIFIADDLGEGDLASYGHPTLRTPGTDRLAREGLRFDRAFLTTSSCSPSRASILTGRYPHSTGAEDLHQPLPSGVWTLARRLGARGYHNAAVGKWHLGVAERRHWHRIAECGGEATGLRALELLDKRPRDRPFFFWVASKDPHRPFASKLPEGGPRPEEVRVPPYLPDHPLVRLDLAHYYAEIERFDRQVERILAKLEEEGVLDDTVVLYLSDNGMPFPRAKTTLYDSGIRTPLLLRYPPLVPRPRVVRGLVSVVDLVPTLLDLLRVEDPAPEGEALAAFEGRSFARELATAPDPGTREGREVIFAEANWHDFEKFTRAVRSERFLLIRNYYQDVPLWNSVDSINSRSWRGVLERQRAGELTEAQRFLFREPRPYEELYDLQLDPASLRSVIDAPEYRESRDALRRRLDNWRVDTRDHMPRERRRDGWTRDGRPLPHNQPWYDRWKRAGASDFEKF